MTQYEPSDFMQSVVLFCGDGVRDTMPLYLKEYVETKYVKEITDLTGADAEKCIELCSTVLDKWKEAKKVNEYNDPKPTVIKIDITTCLARWEQLRWLFAALRFYNITVYIYDDSYDLKKYRSGQTQWPMTSLRNSIDYTVAL